MAHIVGSKVRRAYRREALEKRRRPLEDWNAYATGGEVRQAAE